MPCHHGASRHTWIICGDKWPPFSLSVAKHSSSKPPKQQQQVVDVAVAVAFEIEPPAALWPSVGPRTDF
ncbi:hypothetical protein niasHT_012487 [Heterodera trifolii]|uniref:Uncharacterized protein n=1 Tax=Heterodera trifolii TaxID=157864 RepID=A0ABD2KUK3_9BILA